ncbi:hypothetical protein [Salidesulfovibrio onnuriiensis]|uniref:hypothetical protein n=1 Tax=Salidesulfovibrio onnuriiensis TaxID=2583823 RepID=UPI0011CBF3E0|nr:hypothetical protein [Salidesulfovibrio onnuriiensis]
MKIRPDQIEGVRQEQQKQANRVKQPQQAFGDLLNDEVSKASTPQQSQGVVPPLMVNPLLQTQATEKVDAVGEYEQGAINQMEGLLDKWDDYADKLGSAGLKEAYGALEDISGEVSRLKEQYPDMAERNPGLSEVVNDLDAMAAAEKFKFNRGDYI